MYISIYNRARNQQIPRGGPGAKSDFVRCPVLEACSACFRNLQRRVLDSLLEGPGTSFCALGQRVCVVCEKVFFGLFHGARIHVRRLQKHANRTVHPSKIKGEFILAYVFRNVFQSGLFCFLKAFLDASNCTQNSYSFMILECLVTLWRMILGPFWHA